MVFEVIWTALGSAGVAGLYLPFLLLFAVFYALFTKTKIFGESPRIVILLSFIISLYIVALSPISGTIGLWFASIFAATGVVIVSAIIFFLVVGIMIAPWWKGVSETKHWWKLLLILGIVVAFLIVTGNTFSGVGATGTVTIPGLSGQDIVFLTLVIITILIIYWMTKGGPGKPARWSLLPEI